ncbi:zinc knuckle CX2CX4HX4C containing protein [Tanacetum coccineum]
MLEWGRGRGSAKDQPNVNSNFHTLVADPVFDGVNISIPRKVVENADLGEVVTHWVFISFGDILPKETIRVEYEWRPPRCDTCNIFGHFLDYCPKKVVSPPIVATSNVVTPNAEKTNMVFQKRGKKRKRERLSKSIMASVYWSYRNTSC